MIPQKSQFNKVIRLGLRIHHALELIKYSEPLVEDMHADDMRLLLERLRVILNGG